MHALILMLPLALTQTQSDEDAARAAIAIARASVVKPLLPDVPLPKPKRTYQEVVREAAEKNVPLIVYVNEGDYGTVIDGMPKGTLYHEIDKLDGFPEKCVIVSVPDGQGWMHGWTLRHMATNDEIRAKVAESAQTTEVRRAAAPVEFQYVQYAPISQGRFQQGRASANC